MNLTRSPSTPLPMRVWLRVGVAFVGQLNPACSGEDGPSTATTDPTTPSVSPSDPAVPNGGSGPEPALDGPSYEADAETVSIDDFAAPTVDCLDASRLEPCLSIRGQFGEMSFEHSCSMAIHRIQGGPRRWYVSCEEPVLGMAAWFRIDVRTQAAGTFHHSIDPLDFEGVQVLALLDGAGGDAHAQHLVKGEVAGYVNRDHELAGDVVVGTFAAIWGEPDDDCEGRAMADECLAGQVHGSFSMYFTSYFEDVL